MLAALAAVVGLGLVVALGWRLRFFAKKQRLGSGMWNVDFAAFQNLIRADDDAFLQRMLSPKHYRIAKRARTRAIQQYLLWIANDCLVVQRTLSAEIHNRPQPEDRARLLTTLSLRLRVLALTLWACLWMQRILPQLDVVPVSILVLYEKFAREKQAQLASPESALLA